MLQTTRLSYNYAGSPALDFPDIHCAQGEHWLILGDSGCGKTTLLHLLGGLLTPRSGSIQLDTTELNRLSGAELDHFRGQHIGIIFQRSHFIRALSVEENLLIAQSLAGLEPDRQRVHNLLQRLHVGHKATKRPHSLSQGEQQRVAIARALVNRPKVILADEPTSALDDANTKEVIRLLEEEARQANATLLVVTHDGRLKTQFPKQIQLQAAKSNHG